MTTTLTPRERELARHAQEQPCSAYARGGICANGFPQNAACLGWRCPCRGKPTDKAPMCLRDDVPERFIDESGRPILTSHYSRADAEAALEPGESLDEEDFQE